MENQGTEDIELVGLRNVNAELYQRFRVRCAEKKINYGTGFEQAINAWLKACAGDDLLSQPPFDTINPNVINEFRSRCKRQDLTFSLASPTQWSSGYATMPTLTHILPRTKARLEKRNEKVENNELSL